MQSSLPTRLGTLLRDTAVAEIVPRFRKLLPTDVIAKPTVDNPGDLVTVADRAAEARLTESLPALVPGSVVLGDGSKTPKARSISWSPSTHPSRPPPAH